MGENLKDRLALLAFFRAVTIIVAEFTAAVS
jgi:hypothetical protein